jgi:hypothetical protein
MFKQIKQSFEKEGYKLLSTEYVNAKTYLNFICPNGHNHKITWNAWQSGRRCGKCYHIKISYTYEQIKQSFEKEEYTLISTEYVNAHQKLKFICPNGHKHEIRWNNWLLGRRCGRCCGNLKITYEQIKQSFEKEEYTLISTEYINAKSYIEYICQHGHNHKIIGSAWQQGQRCPECSFIDGSSKTEKEVREYVIKNYTGIILSNDRTLILNPKTGKFLELDIWLPEIKKAIEYGAEWYHRTKYQKWKDLYKQKWCKDNGIELLVIDEKEWKNNRDEICNKIRKLIC